jgi:hypothetical protein
VRLFTKYESHLIIPDSHAKSSELGKDLEGLMLLPHSLIGKALHQFTIFAVYGEENLRFAVTPTCQRDAALRMTLPSLTAALCRSSCGQLETVTF